MINLHISLTSFRNESRVLKETKSLIKLGLFKSIEILALHEDDLDQYEVLDDKRKVFRMRLRSRTLPKSIPFQLVKYMEFCLKVIQHAKEHRPKVVNIHALSLLPVGLALKALFRVKLIYDTHELETEVDGMTGLRQLSARALEKHLIKYCDATVVVNDSIAKWYKQRYSLQRIWTIYNYPSRSNDNPIRTGLLRRELGIQNTEALLFIYQGNMCSGRGIELTLEVFTKLNPQLHVVFMGYGDLEATIKDTATRFANIHYLPAVPPNRVTDYTSGADIGISLIENTCLSYYLSAPNKIYEYLNSGIAQIVSNFPEMEKLINSSQSGWIVEPTVSALHETIKRITREQLSERRARAELVKHQYYWENQESEFLAIGTALGLQSPEQNATQEKSSQ